MFQLAIITIIIDFTRVNLFMYARIVIRESTHAQERGEFTLHADEASAFVVRRLDVVYLS